MKIEWDAKYEILPLMPDQNPNWALEELAAECKRLNLDIDVRELGVPDAYYDGGWCIHQEDGVWLVYLSERGRRARPAIFTSSFDAANYFLWINTSHPAADNSSAGRLPRLK